MRDEESQSEFKNSGVCSPVTERLIKRAVERDESAYREVFDGFRAHLRRYLELRMNHQMRRRIDPSDIIQETQLIAFKRLPDFLERRPMPLRIWLRRMLHEQMLNQYKFHVVRQRRSVKREDFAEHSSMLLAKRLVDREDSPIQKVIAQERKAMMAFAVESLSQGDREILLMKFIEGLSYTEIGYSLEIKEDTARQRCGRALVRLRQAIDKTDWGEST